VAAALTSTQPAAGGTSVGALAKTAATLLEKALSALPPTAAGTSGTTTTTQALAPPEAITAVKAVLAAACSICSFSDADLLVWVSGGG